MCQRQVGRPWSSWLAGLQEEVRRQRERTADAAADPAAVAFDDGRELRFRDIRKFGRIGIASHDGLDGDLAGELGGPKTFRGFGPEPLSAAFTLAVFRRRIRGRRGRLKALLLDQASRKPTCPAAEMIAAGILEEIAHAPFDS